MKKLITTIALFYFFAQGINAQYEHRFSATLSGGVVMPFSTVETTNTFDVFSDEVYDPAAFNNFEPGMAITAGFHLNPGTRFALVINLNYVGLNSWSYDYGNNSEKIYYTNNLTAKNLGLGAAPRLYFNPRSSVRVYMQIEASINYLTLTYDAGDFGYNEILNNTYALGIAPAFGLDVRITEKAGIFLQNGIAFNMYNESQFPTSFTDQNAGIFNEPVDLQKDNLNMLRIELGFRYSFMKSKKI